MEFAYTGIGGWGVKDSNIKLRFFIYMFAGVIAFGAILIWRSQLLFVSEYQEMPVTHRQLEIKKQNQKILKNIQKKLIQDELPE